MRLLLFMSIVLVGCPKPAPRPIPPIVTDIEKCPMDMALPSFENVCDGMYTDEGFACVVCPANRGCLDTVDSIYCVNGDHCTKDRRCTFDTEIHLNKRARARRK